MPGGISVICWRIGPPPPFFFWYLGSLSCVISIKLCLVTHILEESILVVLELIFRIAGGLGDDHSLPLYQACQVEAGSDSWEMATHSWNAIGNYV